MGTENVNKNTLDSSESSSGSRVTASVEIWYGHEDKSKAKVITQDSIVSIKIIESMFSSLPTIKLVLNDTGTYLHNIGFRHGEVFYVVITPNVGDPDAVPAPYVNSKFIIEGIEYLWNTATSDYDYHISGIYAAEKYLNCIFTWPPESAAASSDLAFIKNLGIDTVAPVKTGGFTSDELFSRVVSQAGLTYICDITGVKPTDDRMYWLNKNLTYYEFIQFVTNHAWIAEDDCPIFYVNINGNGIYSSLKTLQKSPSVMTYKDKDRSVLIGEIKKDDRYRMYTNPILKNAGYLQNEGGYRVESNVWNPYHTMCISPVPQVDTPAGVVGSSLPPRIRTIPLPMPEYAHDRTGKNIPQGAYVAKMSNKSPAGANNLRFSTNDIYFPETHQYYDYAPLHNQSLKKGFFTVFLYLTVDCSNQLDFDAKRKRRENLGDKITVDFANTEYDSSIQNGNFIIGSIMHYWSKTGVYQQIFGCVSDGINGIDMKNNSTNE